MTSKDGHSTVFSNTSNLVKLNITGKQLEQLDNEAGGHRIQRISATEKRGRVHTSSVTVAITSPCTTIDKRYSLRDEKHFRVEWFSGTGKGGQHRNKKSTSCRLIHIPTGIVESRQGRKRECNKNDAMIAILSTLDSKITEETNSTVGAIRKQQIGSGMRADKIRTYRFQENIVKDHQTGKQAKCSKVMKGHINLLW